MKKVETTMNHILLNLQLAQDNMTANDFNLAMQRVQDARRSMELLKRDIKSDADTDIQGKK